MRLLISAETKLFYFLHRTKLPYFKSQNLHFLFLNLALYCMSSNSFPKVYYYSRNQRRGRENCHTKLQQSIKLNKDNLQYPSAIHAIHKILSFCDIGKSKSHQHFSHQSTYNFLRYKLQWLKSHDTTLWHNTIVSYPTIKSLKHLKYDLMIFQSIKVKKLLGTQLFKKSLVPDAG